MKGPSIGRLLGIGLVLVFLIVLGYGILYPEARDIATERVDFRLSTEVLAREMALPESAGKYGNRVVRTHGRITAVSGRSIGLDHGIVVQLLEPPHPQPLPGERIAIKARCVGYDELLGEVRLDQGTIVENNLWD